MNLYEHFESVALFLEEYSFLHRKESLASYPDLDLENISTWIQEALSWDDSTIASMESNPGEFCPDSESFSSFLKKVKSLNSIAYTTTSGAELGSNLLRKLNQKKRHEIKKVLGFINQKTLLEKFVDIGSGAGHLSNSIVYGRKRHSFCVDMDSRLQDIGRNKIQYWLPANDQKITFVNEFFSESTVLSDVEPSKSMLLGLHSCGALSTSIVKSFHTNSFASLLNFGCCYHKLEDEYNISNYSKKFNCGLTKQSFFLAERTGPNVGPEDIKLRRDVKKYRYGLHLFLLENFELEFTSVGNAKKSDYSGSFSTYAKKYHQGQELDNISDFTLDEYIKSDKFLSVFNSLFVQDSIRNLLGRLIEIYIILDRAIYLREHGHDVEVFQLFDAKLSPRNLAIYAKKEIITFQKPLD